MAEQTTIEFGGVRIDLAHVHETSRRPMILEAKGWSDQGQRPPILTVHSGGEDVSTRPDLWPDRVRNYRGLGQLKWVGQD